MQIRLFYIIRTSFKHYPLTFHYLYLMTPIYGNDISQPNFTPCVCTVHADECSQLRFSRGLRPGPSDFGGLNPKTLFFTHFLIWFQNKIFIFRVCIVMQTHPHMVVKWLNMWCISNAFWAFILMFLEFWLIINLASLGDFFYFS